MQWGCGGGARVPAERTVADAQRQRGCAPQRAAGGEPVAASGLGAPSGGMSAAWANERLASALQEAWVLKCLTWWAFKLRNGSIIVARGV